MLKVSYQPAQCTPLKRRTKLTRRARSQKHGHVNASHRCHPLQRPRTDLPPEPWQVVSRQPASKTEAAKEKGTIEDRAGEGRNRWITSDKGKCKMLAQQYGGRQRESDIPLQPTTETIRTIAQRRVFVSGLTRPKGTIDRSMYLWPQKSSCSIIPLSI